MLSTIDMAVQQPNGPRWLCDSDDDDDDDDDVTSSVLIWVTFCWYIFIIMVCNLPLRPTLSPKVSGFALQLGR